MLGGGENKMKPKNLKDAEKKMNQEPGSYIKSLPGGIKVEE